MERPPAPASAPAGGGYMPRLDGVRGCAILLVIASHAANGFSPAGAIDRALLPLWTVGWIGVDLFFVLSGFLITGILLDTRHDPRSLRTFFARRALRILPPYLLFLGLTTLALVSHRSEPAWGIWMDALPWHAAYLSNVLVALRGWGGAAFDAAHLWSLAVEEQLYLTLPLAVLFLDRARLSAATVRVLLWLPAVRGCVLALGLSPLAVHTLTPFRFDSLAMGGLLALAIRSPDAALVMGRLRRLALPAALVLAVSVVALRGLPYTDASVQTIGYTALALCFAALIAHLLQLPDSSLLARVFGAAPLRSIGRYSYSIYLFHVPLIRFADRVLWPRHTLPIVAGSRIPALVLYTAAFSAAMWALAAVLWWGYERHFLALKRRFAYSDAVRPGDALPVFARAA